jgi:hypothetical protein
MFMRDVNCRRVAHGDGGDEEPHSQRSPSSADDRVEPSRQYRIGVLAERSHPAPLLGAGGQAESCENACGDGGMRSRARSLLVVTIAVATVLAALVVVGRLTGRSLRSPRGPQATSIPVLVTPTPTPTTLSPVVARIPFDQEQLRAVAVSPQAVWVAHGCVLSRVDPRRNRVVAAVADIPRRGSGCGVAELAVGGGTVWALSSAGLVRIDPQTNRVTRTIVLPNPSGLAVTTSGVWVGCCGPAGPVGPGSRGRLARVDPASGRVVASIPLAGLPGEVGAGPSGVWVTGRGGPVWQVDPTRNRVVATIAVPGGLGGLPAREGPAGQSGRVLVSGDAVWIADPASAAVLHVDPGRARIVGRELADGPGLALVAGTVWGTLGTTLVALGGTDRREVPLPDFGAGPFDERLPITELVAESDALWVAAPAGLLRLALGRLR